MKPRRFITGALGLLLVAGCAAVQPPTNTAPVSKTAPPRPPATVETPAAEPKPPFSLEECLALALRNNPSLQARGFAAQAAQAERDNVSGQRWPRIAVDAGYRHNLDDQRLVQPRYANEPGVYGSDIVTGNLVLTLPLYTSGRLRHQVEAATLLSTSATQQLARTRQELVFNVTQVFNRILAQEQILQAIDRSRQALEAHHRRVQDMLSVQRAARVDLLRTEVRLAEIEQQRVTEANRHAILKRVLANLMGWPARIADFDLQGELTLADVNVDLAEARRRAFEQRPDYRALQQQVAAQESQVKAARAGHGPTVSAEAAYGLRHAASPTTQPAGTDNTEDTGFVGLQATLPIFEGGSIDARIRREQARLLQLKQQLRQLALQIDLDLENARADLEAAQRRTVATRAAVDQAAESLRIEQERYAQGKGTQTDVLDAQAALLTAQTNTARALSDTQTAVAQWHLALGDTQ